MSLAYTTQAHSRLSARQIAGLQWRGASISRYTSPSRCRSTDAARSASAKTGSKVKHVLFDVMDTIVWDPFFTKCPEFLQMSLKELFAVKHPKTWALFERGEVSEEELFKDFFKDGRSFDSAGMKQAMVTSYRYLDGMENLLGQLQGSSVSMHVMSNYPAWWRNIDSALHLSAHVPWTFVSCEGPMQGIRKPEPESYAIVQQTLGVESSELLLIDDRTPNVEGALQAGWDAIQFKDAHQLAAELKKRESCEISCKFRSHSLSEVCQANMSAYRAGK